MNEKTYGEQVKEKNFRVLNLRTNSFISGLLTRKAATKLADKKDLEYGAISFVAWYVGLDLEK